MGLLQSHDMEPNADHEELMGPVKKTFHAQQRHEIAIVEKI
jgi:hypothetical protein